MYKDVDKVTVERTCRDGTDLQQVTTRNYWRSVALTAADPGVPEVFTGEHGRTPVSVHLDTVALEWTWADRARYRRLDDETDDPRPPDYHWELRTIKLVGRQLRKDGTVGERLIERTYFDSAEGERMARYVAPDWLRAIIEDHRPEGPSKPFPVQPIGNV